MDTVLTVSGLCKNYKDFRLNNVNMSLEKGTLTGFIGPNGAGKTTTVRSILNIIRPDSGSINILGLDSVKDAMEIKSKLGVVLDSGHFYEWLTLKKMKDLIAPLYPAWDDDAYNRHIKSFKLPQERKIKDLSAGMRMKYALTLAFSHGAEIFLLDEPATGLDPLARNELIEILRDNLYNEGKTVLMSTHITSDLDKIADNLFFIYNGEIILSGQKDEIKDRHAVVKGVSSSILPEHEKYFVRLSRGAYGFEGITDNKAALKGCLSTGTVYEVPTIEDIMIAYTMKPVQTMRRYE